MDKLEQIKKAVDDIKKCEHDYYKDELWDCGNYDDVYRYGYEKGESDLAEIIKEILNEE